MCGGDHLKGAKTQPPVCDTTGGKPREQTPLLASPLSCWFVVGTPYPTNPAGSQRQGSPYLSISWHPVGWARVESGLETQEKVCHTHRWLGLEVASPDFPLTTCPHVMLSSKWENLNSQHLAPNHLRALWSLYLEDLWLEGKTLGRYIIPPLIIPAHP